MANDINKEDPHYKGEYGSIYEVNRKFPTGGVAGDFVVIEGWAHYWNAQRGTWCVNAKRDSYWDELITSLIEKFKLIRGATYMGVANLDTVPTKVIGAKMYYFATVAGTYKNFDNLVVPQGINVLYSENGSSWVNTTLLEVAQELGVSTNKVVSQKTLNDALAKKFDKESVVQESGKAEDKVMSQRAVSNNLSKINYYVNRIKKGIPNVIEEGFHVADESGNVGLKYDNLGLDAAKLSKHLKELIKNIDGIGENQYTRETAESGYYLIDSEGNIALSYTSDGLNIAKGSANLKKIVKNSDGFLGGLSTMYNGKNPYGFNANKYYVDAIRRTIASDDNVIPFILIAGQSNAVGAAPTNTVPISYKDSNYRVNNYYIWNPDKKTFATFNFNNNNGMSGGNSWKFGFDPFFAESYINYYGKPIYGVKVARGGTAIGLKKGAASFCWNADIKMVEDAGVTSMCRLLLTTISDIKTWARDNNKVLMPLAVLWLQGETDAVYGFQDVYQTNCSEVFSFIRGALGCPSLPIINSPIELNTIKERVTINNAFTTMNGIDDYFKTIDISDFEQGESTEYPTYEMSHNYDFNYRGFDYHFLTRGYQRIGQRMFNIFKELNK